MLYNITISSVLYLLFNVLRHLNIVITGGNVELCQCASVLRCTIG